MHTAIQTLVEAVWIKGQAAEMHIVVTRHQIKREIARIKRQSFDSGAEFRRYLQEARYTRHDVYERVEVLLISLRVQERIWKGVRSEAEKQKALSEFVREFDSRWRERTVCAPAYLTRVCSNGSPAGSNET